MGVILYLGLTGRLPFLAAEREADLPSGSSEDDPRPPRQIDGVGPSRAGADLPKVPVETDGLTATRRPRSWPTTCGTGSLALEGSSGGGGRRGLGRAVGRGSSAWDRRGSSRRGCAPSMPRMPISSSRWSPARGTATACPSRSARGKRRIEEPDPARAFAVGLIYGPSGGGKIVVRQGRAAAASGCPDGSGRSTSRPPPGDRGTPARRPAPRVPGPARRARPGRGGRRDPRGPRPPGPAPRSSIVLDQFEQWLHGHPDAETTATWSGPCGSATASGLQALLLVRDDFWMAITRFLRVLEVRPIEGVNSAAVEPFDARHARPRAGRARPGPGPAPRPGRPGGDPVPRAGRQGAAAVPTAASSPSG